MAALGIFISGAQRGVMSALAAVAVAASLWGLTVGAAAAFNAQASCQAACDRNHSKCLVDLQANGASPRCEHAAAACEASCRSSYGREDSVAAKAGPDGGSDRAVDYVPVPELTFPDGVSGDGASRSDDRDNS